MFLFHLHFFTSSLANLESQLVKQGYQRSAAFVYKDADLVCVTDATPVSELGRIRLLEYQQGSVNVVTMSQKKQGLRMEHLGLYVSETEFEDILKRAEALGLSVSDRGQRTFIALGGDAGMGLRLELQQRSHADLEKILTLSPKLQDLRLEHPNAAQVLKTLSQLLDLEQQDGSLRLSSRSESSQASPEKQTLTLVESQHFRFNVYQSNAELKLNAET